MIKLNFWFYFQNKNFKNLTLSSLSDFWLVEQNTFSLSDPSKTSDPSKKSESPETSSLFIGLADFLEASSSNSTFDKNFTLNRYKIYLINKKKTSL